MYRGAMSEEESKGLEFILTLSCPDKPGIVYAVSSFLVQHSANIIDSQQYGEPDGGLFFMRVHFSVPPPGPARSGVRRWRRTHRRRSTTPSAPSSTTTWPGAAGSSATEVFAVRPKYPYGAALHDKSAFGLRCIVGP